MLRSAAGSNTYTSSNPLLQGDNSSRIHSLTRCSKADFPRAQGGKPRISLRILRGPRGRSDPSSTFHAVGGRGILCTPLCGRRRQLVGVFSTREDKRSKHALAFLCHQILLAAPDRLGAVMLDDSFFDTNGFGPPDSLRDSFVPTTYARNRSRTTGAYLMSQGAAEKIIRDGTLTPAYGTIDFQLESSIKRSEILTHWVIPPLTCAGSQVGSSDL